MREKWLRRFIAMLMVVNILISMVACNIKKPQKSETVEQNIQEMTYEAKDFEIEGLKEKVSNVFVQNGKLYLSTCVYTKSDSGVIVGANEETKELEIHNGIMKDATVKKLYSVNIDGTDLKEITYLKGESNQYVQDMAVGKNGNMAFLMCSYNKNTKDTAYQIIKTDEQGNEIVREDITEIMGSLQESYIIKMLIDEKDRIVMSVDNAVYILDENEKSVKEVKTESDSYVECMALTKGGQIVCGISIWRKGYVSTKLQVLDVEHKKWGEAYELEETYLSGAEALMNGVEYDVYYSDDSGIYGYNMEERKSVKLLDYMASNITRNNCQSIKPFVENQFIGIAFDKDHQTSLVVYNKATSNSLEKTIITFGAVWVDDNVKKQIIEFNKNSKEYQIEIVDYSNEEDPIAKVNADIAAGNIPDILSLSSLPYEEYIIKGMFEDLTPYFEKDENIHIEDMIDSVYKAMKSEDGKLYYISPSFGVSTLIARSSNVGDRTGWTFNECKTVLEEKGDSVRAFYSEDKMGMLYAFVINGLNDFVDWDTGKCSFNSPEFKTMLEICNMGTDDAENYNDDSISMSSLIQEGKVLFIQGWVSLDEVQIYSKMYGNDITFIGYPNKEKQGSYFRFDNQMAIYAGSEVKDGAWEFLRIFMTKEFQGKNDNLDGSPTRQDCMSMLVTAKMATEEYIDELGQYVYPFNGIKSWDDFEVEVGALSQEEADMYISLVNSTTKASSSDNAMVEIVEEEAKTYFAGEKSLDETVNIIQNRITTYVNENR